MPLHRDATYVNLHPPLGASLDGSDQPLNLLESAYAKHWRNHTTRDVLLVDTAIPNLTAIYLGNTTDPAALILPGVSEVQTQMGALRVRASDPAAPSDGVRIYAKDVAGTDHLFARVDGGTVYQLTPGGSFDPTAITLTDNLSGAFRAHEAANDYIRVNTTNTSEAVILGNATTNPSFQWLGSGAWTVGGGVGSVGQALMSNGSAAAPSWQLPFDPEVIPIADNTVDAFNVYEGANTYLAISTANAAEEMAFGNATTNPEFFWLGSGAWNVAGGTGTSGQVLTSNGSAAAPSWQTVSGGSFDPTAITLTDNLSGAFRAHEAANDYIRVNTTNAAESIILGNATTNPSFSLLGTGALLWNAARQITLPDNTANVFRLMEGANEYFGIATTNGSEAIRFGNTTTNPSVTFSGSGALTLPTGHITIPDNTATAFRVREATNNYLAVTTTDASESMALGNATTNPAFSFLGSGALTLPTGGVSIPDNSATSFRVLEGANSYLTVDTTDAAEVVTIGNATTNPAISFAGTGLLRRTGNVVLGDTSVMPSGTNVYALINKTAGTWTGTLAQVLIGEHNGNLSGSRMVGIGFTSGALSTDSVSIISGAATAGATGNRSLAIGYRPTAAGTDSYVIGGLSSSASATCLVVGRNGASTASNQAAFGGGGFPFSDYYFGESVSLASAFTATGITFQPTEATGTNRDGLPSTILGGRGTGTGNAGPTNGSLTLATYPAIGTGTTQHTATPRVRVRADGTTLLGSHNTMSTAAERDEVAHRQTGYSTFPSINSTYNILSVAPENTATDMVYRMHGSVVGWHYDDDGAPVIVERFFSVVFRSISGSLSFVSYYAHGGGTPQTEVGSTSIPSWLQITGATIQIKHTTGASFPGGRMVASVEWHGVVYDPSA